MIEAILWGLVGGSALLIGAWIGVARPPKRQVAIGLVMAFGAGVLISALTFELVEEAFKRGGLEPTLIGLAVGAVLFTAGNWVLELRGAANRKRSSGASPEAGLAIALGTLLDGIPESIVIGLTLAVGGEVSAPIVGAIFLSNVPEALSSSVGLKEAGYPRRYIAGLWSGMAALAGIASGAGYAIADALSPDGEAFVQALAAGAILAMLADTMIPEAYRREFEEHRSALPVGLATVLGFEMAFLLSKFE